MMKRTKTAAAGAAATAGEGIAMVSPEEMARLTATDGATDQGLCTVALKALLPVLEKKDTSREIVDGCKYFLLKCAIDAKTEPQSVHVTWEFEIYVLASSPVVVPLLSDSLALSSAECSGEGRMVIARGRHGWLATQAGVHTLRLTTLCPYVNKTKCSVRLADLPPCSQNSIQFRVNGEEEVEVTIDPSLEVEYTPDTEGHTTVNALFSPTRDLAIRWAQRERREAEVVTEAIQQPLSVTTEHQSLFSLGEGVLLATTQFNYSIRNGTVSVFDIRLDRRLRVLTVEGPELHRWDVIELPPTRPLLRSAAPVNVTEFPPEDDGAAESAEFELVAPPSDTGPTERVLRVQLDHGVSDSYSLNVTSELELHSTTCEFEAPTFRHGSSMEITREKGFIGIEARTNVEVEQVGSCVGCVAVDVEEVPQSLRNRVSSSLLLGYKYLQPNYSLILSVVKHDDVNVLIAAADASHFICTATEEGKLMYKLIMELRNTQKQYVRVKIPVECEIWTTFVQGRPVKPARDKTSGEVMIPLPKSSTIAETQKSFTAEIVWVAQSEDKMEASGSLSFLFPAVDIVVNKVLASVHTPTDYALGEFTGDLSEVTRFSQTPPVSQDKPPAKPMPMVMQQQNLAYRRESCSSLDLDEDIAQAQVQFSTNVFGGSGPGGYASKSKRVHKAGVMPVHVQMVTSGKEYRFERLLVADQAMELRVDYKQEVKRKPRRLDKPWYGSCALM